MKTFKEFLEETYEYIEEGSSGERGRRRLSPRGPSSDKWERNKQRSVSSSNAALKKAGFSRSTKYLTGTKGRPTKWTETSTSSHHGTETGTYANQSDYASRKVPKIGATSTRVSKLKKIRTQLGGDRTSRPVHDVEVTKKRTYNDTPSSTMTRGRSFRKEVTKGVSDNLKKAGAKPGDIITATPTSSSRSRMYGRTHNVRTDRKTGILVDRIREELKLIREGAHFSTKFGKTYNRCVKEDIEELEESSSGERSGRRTRGKVTLARGRGADMTRQERTTAAIAKKAGLKGTGKYSTKDLRSKTKVYSTDDSYGVGTKGSTKQDTIITTHSSPRQAAEREGIINKSKSRFTSGGFKTEIKPSSDSVRRVKDLRKQITKVGASKRGQVHSVDILPRDMSVSKGDKKKQIERSKNFIQALKDTPKHLKAAGAMKGETVFGKPTAVMDGEDQKTGVAKRAKLYKKVFGKKSTEKSAKTGLMTGKVD